ncbi:MAG: nucleoside deaminase [Phycisphaerales bacterium JB050]
MAPKPSRIALNNAAAQPTGDYDHLMRAAIDVACDGAADGGVPIGCVLFTDDGTAATLGYNEGHKQGDQTRHAEMVALRRLIELPDDERPNPEGLTLVTTLEPCLMCMGAAVELGIGRVIYGLEAPGNGFEQRIDLRSPKRGGRPVPGGAVRWMPEVIAGMLREDCRDLWVRWLEGRDEGAPGVGFAKALMEQTEGA